MVFIVVHNDHVIRLLIVERNITHVQSLTLVKYIAKGKYHIMLIHYIMQSNVTYLAAMPHCIVVKHV